MTLMNTSLFIPFFAALAGGDGSLVNMLIAVVVIGLVCFLLWWLIDYAGTPQPFNKVGKVLIALVAVVLLIRLIVRVTGVSL